jgi:lipoate-protein ligase A
MSEVWRLLVSPPARGARNMAVDEAILDAVARAAAPPSLRLYAWQPACLSLGHAQPAEVVDVAALHALGWQVVRRPTGGRALLHVDEVTYAVIAPESHAAVAGGVITAYRNLSRGLVRGLGLLGLEVDPPELGAADHGDLSNPVCFEVPSAYEITVGGKKLIGSAQLRRRGAVLQHGALPLQGDLTRLLRVLRYPDEAARRLAGERLLEHATTLDAALGRRVAWSEAARAVADGFAAALGWRLQPGELSSEESRDADRREAAHASAVAPPAPA